MNTITNTQITDIVIDIFERTCFLIADEIEDDDIAHFQSQITWSSKIEYNGTHKGAIFVDASDGFLQELASCMLGVTTDEVDLEEDGVQACREITNIIAGSIILSIGGDHDEYKLGLPEKGTITRTGIAAECYLAASCGVVHVHWHPQVDEIVKAA